MKKVLGIVIAAMMIMAIFAGCAQIEQAAESAGVDVYAVKEQAAEVIEEVTENAGDVIASATEAVEAATGDDDWAYVSGNGKLVIGITEYAPMNYYDDAGELTGFDTEYALAVCEKLGVAAEFVVIDWDTKELELKSKTIDCIWNGLTVSDERRENMDFTVSYLANKQCVVVKADKAADYADLASFAGAAVVAEGGSAGETAIAAGMADAAYTAVAAQSDALLEVKAGTADAAVIDLTMANAMVGEGTDYSDLIKLDIDMMDEEYAIGFRPGSNVVAKVNEATEALAADGTLAALAEKYELSGLYMLG